MKTYKGGGACFAVIYPHWVDTWWASTMSVVDRLCLKILDYIKLKAISIVRSIIVQSRYNL